MKRKILLVVIAFSMVISGAFFISDATTNRAVATTVLPSELFLFNPYRDIDFATIGRYRASLHNHTFNSDGFSSMQRSITRNAGIGFNILAFADHDFVSYPWDNRDVLAGNIIGPGPGGRDGHAFDVDMTNCHGLLAVQGNELSWFHHIGSYFTDFEAGTHGSDITDEFSLLKQASAHADKAGRFTIKHPGRYTSWDANEQLVWSDRPTAAQRWVTFTDMTPTEWYQNIFASFSRVLAIEVFNQNDRYANDRRTYDQIMTGIMPARPVWLMANDDNHSNHYGVNVNVMLMPAGSVSEPEGIDEFRKSFERGAFFAKSFGGGAIPENLEIPEFGGQLGSRWNYVPVVEDIIIDEITGNIELRASQHTHIEWITEGGVVAGAGNRINFRTNPLIRGYVRGVLTNRCRVDGTLIATTLMQPFGVGPYDADSWFFYFTGQPSNAPSNNGNGNNNGNNGDNNNGYPYPIPNGRCGSGSVTAGVVFFGLGVLGFVMFAVKKD
ncbi:MAG: hypothetical protein FWC80_00290 [Firmicutes bacterium]|nr:hypothetical protein [Bacillota bacterium]